MNNRMKNKINKSIILTLFPLYLVYALCLNPLAYGTEAENSIAEAAGADEISGDYLEKDELSGDKGINIFEKVIGIIADAFTENGSTVIKAFGAITGMLLLCCVMHALKLGDSASLDAVCGYISVTALAGVTYGVLYELFIYVIASMESLSLLMSSFLPVTASLYVMGGTSAAGAAASGATTLFLTVLSLLCTKAVLPMLRISFALSLSGALPNGINLGSVTGFIKSLSTTVMAFLFTLLGFVLYFQTTAASASDGFFSRSVRFATGVFVPVIGNMLGDASKTVLSSVSVVKGTVGTAGTVLIFSVIIPPIIVVILYKLALLGCSVIAKTLGCDREGAFLCDIGNTLGILMALVIGAGAVSVIAMAVFIKTGVSA